jgi:hypothetical protein
MLLESVGAVLGSKTKTASMLINLAQGYTGEDYRKSGSTLARLGISGDTVKSLLMWLNTEIPAQGAGVIKRNKTMTALRPL